ncbi:MAG: hypothetical protein AUK37_02980 [Rhodobacterales bacterium CG2_30_65_12]|nr:MAG: hypothetical protein AUK37_02980 [Rhodobacterales bacterium CG2_30_65_12]
MKFNWGYLFGMALQTVPEPRKVAREVQGLGYPRRVLWQALGLLLVAGTFLAVIGSILFPVDPETAGALFADPILTGIAQATVSVLTVFGIYWIGRVLGGTGSFDQALLTVIWLQFVLLIIELGVVFLGVFAPGLALILWVMGMVMTFWILSHFIAEMHGFRSAGAVFGGIFLVLIMFAVAMSIVFSLLGIGANFGTGTAGLGEF